MSKIIFTSVTYKNFRSVGDAGITIKLNTHKTTLIAGTNGSGKSTALHALCFCLFGRGYGSGRKSALINSVNQKQLLVTLEFTINTHAYKINRGIKPNIFEIFEDNVLINQDPNVKDYQKVLEQQILKFNYRAFSQVIAVGGGTDYMPFMKLPVKDRREFVEDLLDIRVFTTMNTLIKDQNKTLKEDLKEIDVLIRSMKDNVLHRQSFINKLRKDKEESATAIESHMTDVHELIAAATDDLTKSSETLSVHLANVEIHNELDDILTTTRLNHKTLISQLTKKKEKQAFYEHLDTCPTCTQTVAEEHKHKIVQEVQSEIDDIVTSASTMLTDETILKEKMKSYSTHLESYVELAKHITNINKDIFAHNAVIKNAKERLTLLTENTTNINDELSALKGYATEYTALTTKKKEMLETQQYQEFLLRILSDTGIKSKIIKQYVPTINSLINKYLDGLEIFLHMQLDEQFSESFKSRHRDTFTYDNFSEGQKRRIDIAILLTWMEIAKAKNALHVNICFLDEIDAVMDKEGSELLHAVLKTVSAENIFIISHKSDLLVDKVDHSIHFEIKNSFTQLVTH